MQDRNRGGLIQRWKGGHSPSSVRALHTACRRRIGGGGNQEKKEDGSPPEQRVILAHGMPSRKGGGGDQGGREGTPLVGAHALRTLPDTGYGGRPPRPAEASHRKTKQCGGGKRIITIVAGRRRGTPPPLGGRWTTEEQALAIVANIVNLAPGGEAPSSQTPAIIQQSQHTRGSRGRVIMDRSG